MKNIILWEIQQINYVLLARVKEDNTVHEYVCAWNYDHETKSWGQGHYFQTLTTAYNYIVAVLNR